MEHSYHSLENPGMRRVEAKNGSSIEEGRKCALLRHVSKVIKMNGRTLGD